MNFLACKIGEGYCNATLLAAAEAKEVADAKRQRNSLACESGWGICDRSLLNAEESKEQNSKPSS
jgi:hypothetical protein